MLGIDAAVAMKRMKIESIIIGCSGNDMDEQFKDAGSDWVWGKPTPPNKVIVEQLRAALVKKAKVGKWHSFSFW